MLLGQTSTGWSAGLHRLKFLTILDATTNLEDNFTKGGSHGNLDQSHVINFTSQGKYFGPFGGFGSYAAKPFGSF